MQEYGWCWTVYSSLQSKIGRGMMRTYNTESAIVSNPSSAIKRRLWRPSHLILNRPRDRTLTMEQSWSEALHGAGARQGQAPAKIPSMLTTRRPAMYHGPRRVYHQDQGLRRRRWPQKIGNNSAGHNADTVRYGVKRMAELDLDPQERVCASPNFLGMCDQITSGQAGYSLQICSIQHCEWGLPYLSRRANEMEALGKVALEKNMLGKNYPKNIGSNYTNQRVNISQLVSTKMNCKNSMNQRISSNKAISAIFNFF